MSVGRPPLARLPSKDRGNAGMLLKASVAVVLSALALAAVTVAVVALRAYPRRAGILRPTPRR